MRYFTLARKSDPRIAVPFATIDVELCAFLGVDCDPKKYHASWYDLVGMTLCSGDTLASMVQKMTLAGNCNTYVKIFQWLDENFIPDAWAM